MRIAEPLISVEIDKSDEVLFHYRDWKIIRTSEGIIHIIYNILITGPFLYAFGTTGISYHGFIFDIEIGDFKDRIAVWTHDKICIHISKETCQHIHYTCIDGSTIRWFTSSFDKENYIEGYVNGSLVYFSKANNQEITEEEALAL